MKKFKQYLTETFSNSQIDVLKKEYESLSRIDPASTSYKKLIKLLNSLPQDKLKQLSDAQIKFISPLAKNRLIKVGDKIRTIKGGQIPGVVTKIDGNNVHFDHATDVYTTDISGAKGKPKQYMVHINNIIKEELIDERCWDGYKPTPGKKAYEKGSCMKEDIQEDAEYEGRQVILNKPVRTPDGPKKFAVYVKNDKGNVVKVTFGDPNMEIKRDNPERKKSYRARHNCSDPGPKWKANYWSCKMWDDVPVSKITESTNNYDLDILDGPRTKRKVGGIIGIKGTSLEDAILRYMKPQGYKKVDILSKDDIIIVRSQWGSDSKDIDISYYKLKTQS